MLTNEEICCNSMKRRMRDILHVQSVKADAHIYYEESTRTYYWGINDDLIVSLFYCPWCGKKLPMELEPDYTIKKEYGEDYVRYPSDPKYKPLPPELMKEFETDEWWKKRNIGPDDPGF